MGATTINFIAGIQGPKGDTGALALLSSLPRYTSEAAAISAGLVAGDAYIVANGSDVAQAGTVMVVMSGLAAGTGPTISLSQLQQFTDDAAAIAGGLFAGNIYIVAPGSDAHQAGTIRIII